MLSLWRLCVALAFGLALVSEHTYAIREMSDSCHAHSKEKVPKYRIAQQHRNEGRKSVVLNVSVAPSDVSQMKLISLACKLAMTYASEKALVIWILDDYRAARRFNPQGEGNDAATTYAFRGSYSFNRENNDNSLIWLPDPNDHSSRIEVKLGALPAQREQVN